jgi:hypothetical protein
MKTIRQAIIGAVVLLFASAIHSFAITNTMITVSSGTNIVLYWPSYGYETYLIQYRQTLSATDSWSQLTNAYYANSTNFTTYTLYGVVPPPSSGGSGSGGSGGGSPPAPDMAMGGSSTTPGVPMAAPANGSGNAVPLALYPPGFDLTGFNIFDPTTGEWTSGNGYTVSASSYSSMMGEGATPMDGGVSPDDTTNDVSAPTTGFFRVFHIPDWLVSFDGYQFDGPTFIPVDYEEPDAPEDHVDDSVVLINGQPTGYSQFTPYVINNITYWGVGIFFDRFPNGTNTIQLLTTIRQSDTLNGQTPSMTFSNAPQTIVIANTISFTNWDDFIWNNTNYTFNAQSSIPNVNWEIDVYDVNGYFVNSQTGFSADGNISWTWDLTDTNGTSRNDDGDPYFYPYITISQSAGPIQPDQTGEPDPMPPVARSYPNPGAWIVSYMDNFYVDGITNPSNPSSYSQGIGSIAGAAADWSIPVESVPIEYGRTYTQTNRNDSWNNLKAWLQTWNFRNFYYFGHGNPSGIGGDTNITDGYNVFGAGNAPGTQAYLADWYVRQNITVNPYSGSHPYRFVFIDACNTGKGDLPDAFGVPKQQQTLGYYQSATTNPRHVRPSAYVGWNTEIGANTNGWGTVDQFWNFRETWAADWSLGGSPAGQETLINSLDFARDNTSWASPSQVNSDLCVYGYWDLQYRQYNYGGDWP